MTTSSSFRTLFTHNTVINADSVEWCPVPPYQNYFACGTYCCTPAEEGEVGRVRKGTIILFSVTRDDLLELSRTDTRAVLEMRWCPVLLENNIVLGTATGNGEVRLYNLIDADLRFVAGINLSRFNSTDFLILSIDWPKWGNSNLICCSDSNGYVSLLKFENQTLTKLKYWKAHFSEVWTTTFDTFNSNVLYSGGDDSRLNVWDLRAENPIRSGRTEKHASGVTTLGSHPSMENCLISGSYDETVLLWDPRNWREPTKETNASGGVWRLKWKPREECRHILAACIFAGFEVINPFSTTCVARYREHESLAYGVDWSHLDERAYFRRGQYLTALCSFYDQKLSVCLWNENAATLDGVD